MEKSVFNADLIKETVKKKLIVKKENTKSQIVELIISKVTEAAVTERKEKIIIPITFGTQGNIKSEMNNDIPLYLSEIREIINDIENWLKKAGFGAEIIYSFKDQNKDFGSYEDNEGIEVLSDIKIVISWKL